MPGLRLKPRPFNPESRALTIKKKNVMTWWTFVDDAVRVIDRQHDFDLVLRTRHLLELDEFGESTRSFRHAGKSMKFSCLYRLDRVSMMHVIVKVPTVPVIILMTPGTHGDKSTSTTQFVFIFDE